MLVLLLGSTAFAQSSKADKDQPESNEPAQKFYKLDYVLRELDGNKEISKRSYTISMKAVHDDKQIRTGSRVPVAIGPGVNNQPQFQYMDVGVNIDTMTREDAHGLSLEVTADLTSIAANEGGSSTPYSPPLMRQAKIRGSVPVIPGKSTQVFSVDEPTSSRRFELSVTATQVR